MTMPCAVDTDVVDGPDGSVDAVVDVRVDEAGVAVVVPVVVVAEAAGAAGVLESEHAAPNAIDAATSATTVTRRLLRSR